MKVKMIKMGMDIDETRNHRIRGIIPTENEKYLFVEILQGNRPDRKYTSLSQAEYEKAYPNEEYIWIDGCFRVDIPEDYFKNYTKGYSDEYDKHFFRDYKHTKENIVKVLQQFNKNIDDVELTDDYYLDKFCDEKGFYRLYDDRLKHSYSPLKIEWCDLNVDGECKVKFLYTCYSANGEKYKEEIEYSKKTKELIEEYGEEQIKNLLEDYGLKNKFISISTKTKESYESFMKDLFNKKEIINIKTMEDWNKSSKPLFEDFFKPGDLVGEDVIKHFENVQIPITDNKNMLQMGEPINFVDGKNTYMTFTNETEGWIYRGDCHRGEKEPPFEKWLNTFIEEKEIDLDQVIEIETETNTHYFEVGNIIDNIKATTAEEQAEIKDMIVKIDFHNGDVVDYFRHLAQALIPQEEIQNNLVNEDNVDEEEDER